MSSFAWLAFFTFVAVSWAGRQRMGPLWLLPVTLTHELAHWSIAAVLGARPSFPNILPKKQSDGSWLLGSVTFSAGSWSAGAVGLAPLLLIPVALWLVAAESVQASLLAGAFFAAARLSPQDWTIALKAPVGAIVVLIPVGGAVLHGSAPLFP